MPDAASDLDRETIQRRIKCGVIRLVIGGNSRFFATPSANTLRRSAKRFPTEEIRTCELGESLRDAILCNFENQDAFLFFWKRVTEYHDFPDGKHKTLRKIPLYEEILWIFIVPS